MRQKSEIVVWVWSSKNGIQELSFPNLTEAWAFCADHPDAWLRLDEIRTIVVFDKQDPLGLDTGTPEPIKKEDHHG